MAKVIKKKEEIKISEDKKCSDPIPASEFQLTSSEAKAETTQAQKSLPSNSSVCSVEEPVLSAVPSIPVHTSGFARQLAAQNVGSDAPHVQLKALAGCLAADTIINVNRASKASQMTIKKVVKQFTGDGAYFWKSDIQKYVRMRPWDKSIPTKVARADGEVIRLGVLKNAWESGEKETFLLTTDSGRSIRATAIHPFLMDDGGWKMLQEIQIGDGLQVNAGRSAKGRGPKIHYKYVLTAFHPNQVNNGPNFKVPKHRAVVEANLNELTLCEFLWIVRHDRAHAEKLQYLPTELFVHHKNENTFDNSLSNLELVEGQKEHGEEHEWVNNVLWQVGFENVVSIESYGKEMTYDLEVEDDPHNFLANGFVVHNTGKTTSCVEGLKYVKGVGASITPSPQQEAFWKQLALGKSDSVRLSAFNTTITDEMKAKIAAAGLDKRGCEARGVHSLGYAAVTRSLGRVQASNWTVIDLCAEVLGGDYHDLKKQPGMASLINATDQLVGLCKQNLCEPTPENIDQLAGHYDVEMNGNRGKIIDLVPQVLDRCKSPKGKISFDDMVWLPLVLQLPIPKVDVQIIDEAQDLNRMQQELIYRGGHRVVFVGDEHQAIYGFAGADAESMQRMSKTLGETARGIVELPLTVTRRCGRAIVAEAKKIVPAYEAHESCPEGMVAEAKYPIQGEGERRRTLPWEETYCKDVRDGAMILCRVNAPLVSECFRFLKRKIKANILGRKIGEGLVTLVEKSKVDTANQLRGWLGDWLMKEMDIENKKKYPSEARQMALQDKHDCILCFTDDCNYVSDVIRKIKDVFTDSKDTRGIRLASIHKSKGLEADQVFFLQPKGGECPHPLAKSAWQREQERNLYYVACTRAINELHMVY